MMINCQRFEKRFLCSIHFLFFRIRLSQKDPGPDHSLQLCRRFQDDQKILPLEAEYFCIDSFKICMFFSCDFLRYELWGT